MGLVCRGEVGLWVWLCSKGRLRGVGFFVALRAWGAVILSVALWASLSVSLPRCVGVLCMCVSECLCVELSTISVSVSLSQ